MHFPVISNVCANFINVQEQTAVSHSSTEALIISFEALLFWECVVDDLTHSTAKGNLQQRHVRSEQRMNKRNKGVAVPHSECTIHSTDYVPQRVALSNNRVRLLVIEDNEAGNCTLMKGRSRNVRHV